MFRIRCLADDFKTVNGKEYKNVKVSRVEPDGIVLITSSGISKVYFSELPQDVQQRFNYDAAEAAQFTAATQTAAANAQAKAAAEQAAAKRAPAAAQIMADFDGLAVRINEGNVLQVLDGGILLRGPAYRQNGSRLEPVRWMTIFIVGSFPGAVDGMTWTGWIWPAGTYTYDSVGAGTVERWATSKEVALDLQLKSAAGRLGK